jgi:hypothetical protein
MKSCFGFRVVLGAFLALVSCDGSMLKGGAARDAGPSGQIDSGQRHDAATADQATPSCPAVTRPASCTNDSALCITDLRAVRSRFPTCSTGYAYRAFVVSCGVYDGVVSAGADSATTYYFDRSDGHLVGVTNTGLTTLAPCGAFDPSFTPTVCDSAAACPADAGQDT